MHTTVHSSSTSTAESHLVVVVAGSPIETAARERTGESERETRGTNKEEREPTEAGERRGRGEGNE